MCDSTLEYIKEKINLGGKIYSFGAGTVGKKIYNYLMLCRISVDNFNFVDNFKSHFESSIEYIKGVKISLLTKQEMLRNITDKDIVIISVGEKLVKEITSELEQEPILSGHKLLTIYDILSPAEEFIKSTMYSFDEEELHYESDMKLRIVINATTKYSFQKLQRTINSIQNNSVTSILLLTSSNVDSDFKKIINKKMTIINVQSKLPSHKEVIKCLLSDKYLNDADDNSSFVIFMNIGDSLSTYSIQNILYFIRNNSEKKVFLADRDIFFKNSYISPFYRSKIKSDEILLKTMFNDLLITQPTYFDLIKNNLVTKTDIAVIPKIIYHVDYDNIDKTHVKPMAFYLTQYHTIPENDIWWGKGFTEWTNTKKAKPLFDGHYQPHEPHDDIGYYDLMNDDEIQKKQMEMAKKYGIYGFCYYYYHFSGKRLLEKPLNKMLENKQLDFPFCIFWANETWSRRWDGQDSEILIKQNCDENSCMKFIDDVIPLFKDSRYIKINEKPLLIVYRAKNIPDFNAIVEKWKKRAELNGLKGLEIVVTNYGVDDPRLIGSDSLLEFALTKTVFVDNKQCDYNFYASVNNNRTYNDFMLYPSCVLGFDNTARKGKDATIISNFTFEEYQKCLACSIDYITTYNDKDNQYTYIFAWNEWAEAAHLEPDKKYGYKYLEATAEVVK